MTIILMWNKLEWKEIPIVIYYTYLEDELQPWLNGPE